MFLQLLLLRLHFHRPGEVSDGDDEEAMEFISINIFVQDFLLEDRPVGIIEDTGQSIIPGQEGSHQSEKASGTDDGWIRRTGRVRVQVADTEEQESQI